MRFRECSKETINNRMLLLDKGYCFINNGYFVFKFLGNYYGNNLKRKKMYSMDDRDWYRFSLSLFYKVYLVITKQVRRLYEKKSY